ncbi:1,6-anhydro-N-acetylmuramyl-L-alanine amidase AmpD [Alginatibacterium sediminis]|uniref:1,6-anhydro-N-acetylmuramyl-L-alanine amidase AmpD n=1 Tax=Alginatibacterium sediminis TaxID=2164068 RepID=A0A420EJV5_9ALTE|nr:1,6-anhydro-N-acetylmuramyl-L-alanine amidase AmpD [Alginatibacterium sediminis]RKF20940.1 1,6-anhydro-N-acetylmuramyl-L-alanine amidase AmpD [Alginatibacterium sediminis]
MPALLSFRDSPHFDLRPNKIDISVVVVHCISLPESCFNLPYIEQLFMGQLDCNADPSFSELQGLRVSAHLVIKRDGSITQYVPFDKRAWHAGVSSYELRDNCNDFAIGIELEGDIHSSFEAAQYQSLNWVCAALYAKYPLISRERLVAHSDIAPGRKLDPGPFFDWTKVV